MTITPTLRLVLWFAVVAGLVGIADAQPPTRYVLTVNRIGTGTGIVSGPQGLNCGTHCVKDYPADTAVTLNANPTGSATFSGWAGACTGTGACTVTMAQAHYLYARFDVGYALNVAVVGTGAATSVPEGIACPPTCKATFLGDTTVTIVANAANFTGWSEDCAGTGSCTVTMTQTRNVTATFASAPVVVPPPTTQNLTVTRAGTGTGVVTSAPAGITCGGDCTEPYAADTSVTLTAAPASGSTFAGWSGACTGTAACSVVMAAARDVTATFTATVIPPVAGCSTTVNPDQPSVAAAISSAAAGAVVCLNAGSSTWTAGVSINKVLTLKGANPCTGGTPPSSAFTGCPTTITNNFTTGSLINVTAQAGGSVRIENLALISGTGPGTSNPHGFIRIGGGGKPPIIKGVLVSMTTGTACNGKACGNGILADTNLGIVSGSTFRGLPQGTSCDNENGVLRLKPISDQASWKTPSSFGTADTSGTRNFYFEDSWVSGISQAFDVSDNGRLVIRYSNLTNSHVGGHGADTSYYGMRSLEIYNSTIGNDVTKVKYNCGGVQKDANVNSVLGSRGGTMLIHHNEIPAIPASPNWGSKAAVLFQAQQPRRNAGPYACWTGPYPIAHQVGWGYTTGGTGPIKSTSTAAPAPDVYQDREPVYFWANTGTGNYTTASKPSLPNFAAVGTQCPNGADISTFIQFGRDIMLETPMPNYTPYPYPHPLVTGGQ